MPERLNQPRAGYSVDGDRVEILAHHTNGNRVKIHFTAPELGREGDIILDFDEAWRFASDVISSALKINPIFLPSLLTDLDTRIKLLESKVDETSS